MFANRMFFVPFYCRTWDNRALTLTFHDEVAADEQAAKADTACPHRMIPTTCSD